MSKFSYDVPYSYIDPATNERMPFPTTKHLLSGHRDGEPDSQACGRSFLGWIRSELPSEQRRRDIQNREMQLAVAWTFVALKEADREFATETLPPSLSHIPGTEIGTESASLSSGRDSGADDGPNTATEFPAGSADGDSSRSSTPTDDPPEPDPKVFLASGIYEFRKYLRPGSRRKRLKEAAGRLLEAGRAQEYSRVVANDLSLLFLDRLHKDLKKYDDPDDTETTLRRLQMSTLGGASGWLKEIQKQCLSRMKSSELLRNDDLFDQLEGSTAGGSHDGVFVQGRNPVIEVFEGDWMRVRSSMRQALPDILEMKSFVEDSLEQAGMSGTSEEKWASLVGPDKAAEIETVFGLFPDIDRMIEEAPAKDAERDREEAEAERREESARETAQKKEKAAREAREAEKANRSDSATLVGDDQSDDDSMTEVEMVYD